MVFPFLCTLYSFLILLFQLIYFVVFFFFFFNDTATTEIYTLSLHDALPIYPGPPRPRSCPCRGAWPARGRSEEHTSELQSRRDLVCRLLLEKKKKKIKYRNLKINKQQNTNEQTTM